MSLKTVHPLTIQLLNTLPNLTSILVVVGKIEFLSPVAKIRREDKQIFWLIEVRSKDTSVVISHFLIDWSSENRYNFNIFAEYLYNERQLHLNTMLVLIIVDVQHMKSLLQL
jgi:hypothetical protein